MEGVKVEFGSGITYNAEQDYIESVHIKFMYMALESPANSDPKETSKLNLMRNYEEDPDKIQHIYKCSGYMSDNTVLGTNSYVDQFTEIGVEVEHLMKGWKVEKTKDLKASRGCYYLHEDGKFKDEPPTLLSKLLRKTYLKNRHMYTPRTRGRITSAMLTFPNRHDREEYEDHRKRAMCNMRTTPLEKG